MQAEDPAELYEAIYETLCEMTTALRKKDVDVPSDIATDLRSARALISGHRTDPEAVQILSQVQSYLKKVERKLIEMARSEGLSETASEFLERLDEARRGARKRTSPGPEIRFIPGLPRNGRWVRIKISPKTPLNTIEEVAAKSRVSLKPQEEGFVLATGRSENLREFIRILRSKTKP